MEPLPQSKEIGRARYFHRRSSQENLPEDALDRLTQIAAHIFTAPIALISLVETGRTWLTCALDLKEPDISRLVGFCTGALTGGQTLVVSDATADRRFASHPLVAFYPKLRFYVGVPLVTRTGGRIGTLSVVDNSSRIIQAEQLDALAGLAQVVVDQRELWRSLRCAAVKQRSLMNVQKAAETGFQQSRDEFTFSLLSLQQLLCQVLRAQDDERRRVARELHDSTGRTLSALRVTVARIRKDAMFPDLSRIDQCSELITRAANDLTNICGYLHPLLIDEQGLAVAVEDYARGFEKRSGLEIRVDIPQDVQRLDIDREITLFRVIQESLESIHQHSGSPTAHIRMSASDSDIVLEVRDYGRALLSEELNNAVGIRSMRERVRNVGGSLLLESSSNGTVVRAILPL